MSEVLYRKYRPKTFKDVLGQDHIVRAIEGAVAQGNISHAYLFSGGRGTGKTSLARIIARQIGVSDKDLYEIDAASNRGIDDIRELRDAVNTLPFDSPYKVYIVDEVHMLTKEAFNAFLKTLEEPPAHVLFILATTEVEKLPETIVSRCQSFTFRKPSQSTLKETIHNIAKKEGFNLEHSSSDLIALLADGSFRDALGILQKVIFASSDKNINLEEVERITGAPRGELINKCLLSFSEKNLEEALSTVHQATVEGVDMSLFTAIFIQKIRFILLLVTAPELKEYIKGECTDNDFKLLHDISTKKCEVISTDTLLKILQAHSATSRASIPQLPLELALIDILS